ncbi:MAG: hypothetical protein ABI480_04425 [Chitinophagaceae bacterium]
MKKLSLIIFLTSLVISSFAQTTREDRKDKKEAKRQKINEMVRQAEEGVLVYEKQNIFGIQLRSNGYGAFYELGKMRTNRKTNIYRLDIAEIKDHREEKLFGGSFLFGNPYIYGKINFFYPVTLGFGQQYILGQKGNKNGVAVSAIYNAGLSIGLLRPYYVDAKTSTNEIKAIKYSSQDSLLFLSSDVQGASGLGKGWGDLKIKPGGFVKAAMRFDYGRFNESVNALEIGMNFEMYASKIPLLLLQKDKRMFFEMYIAILFGKRK